MSTTTTNPPTVRQRSILNFIRNFISGSGYPPTIREIGRGMGITSPNGVMCHLRALKKKGLIRTSRDQSRSIQLIHREGDTCPFCGK